MLTRIALVSAVSLVSAQFISAPSPGTLTSVAGGANTTVRYKHVATGPGSICELTEGVTSLSGYVDVSSSHHIFFWLFTARHVDPSEAPLTVWISGGPGDSSMSELFTEHGPCAIDPISKEVISNPYSWNNYSNVVYIDQPVSVGFSYSDPVEDGYIDQNSCNVKSLRKKTCPQKYLNTENNCAQFGLGICGTFSSQSHDNIPDSTPSAATDFYYALQGVIGAFPTYSKGGLNFGSESYGGHYVPVYSRLINQQNDQALPGHVHLPLKSVLIGNGWIDPAVSYTAHYNFSVDPGNTYNVRFNSSQTGENMRHSLVGSGQCLDQLVVCNNPANQNRSDIDHICKTADDFCTKHVQQVYDHQLHRDEYDVREKAPDPFIYLDYINYLGHANVVRELGVRVNYTDASNPVGANFESTGDDGKELGTVESLRDLLSRNISVTLYHGDADYNCNWLGGEMVAAHVLQGLEGYENLWGKAGYVNVATADGIVHGQVKQVGRFSFTRVYQAGHAVGFYQPAIQQTLFERTNAGLDIATGQINITSNLCYTTVGPMKSMYVEGGATVQNKTTPQDAVYNTTLNEPNP